MLLPQLVPVLNYLNGSKIYLSSIHPIVLETQELEREKIDVVVSLLEERDPPGFVKQPILAANCRHYYYNTFDRPEEPVSIVFISTYNVISRAVESNQNVLIYCRSGRSLCVTILVAFLLRAVAKELYRFIVYDRIHYIPKTQYTWTESFLEYLKGVYPEAEPNVGFLQQLFELERDLIRPKPPGLGLDGLDTFDGFTAALQALTSFPTVSFNEHSISTGSNGFGGSTGSGGSVGSVGLDFFRSWFGTTGNISSPAPGPESD